MAYPWEQNIQQQGRPRPYPWQQNIQQHGQPHRPGSTSGPQGPSSSGGGSFGQHASQALGSGQSTDYPFAAQGTNTYVRDWQRNRETDQMLGQIPSGGDLPWYWPTGPGGGGSGSRGGGGGGGAPSFAGIDQGTFDYLLGMLGQQKPQQWNYQQLGQLPQMQALQFQAPQYNAPEFYDFNSQRFDNMLANVGEAADADRRAGAAAYGDARTELEQYRNPFAGGLQTQNPGVMESMRRMMEAHGVNPGQVAQVDAEGAQADQAMGNVMALLAGVDQQRQGSNMRALSGDERRFNENIQNRQRMAEMQVQMAQDRALSQWEKDRWQYGVDVANQQYQITMNEAMTNFQAQTNAQGINHQSAVQQALANWQGGNEANQFNVGATNQFNQQAINQLLDLVLSGMNEGSQTLTLPDPASIA